MQGSWTWMDLGSRQKEERVEAKGQLDPSRIPYSDGLLSVWQNWASLIPGMSPPPFFFSFLFF